MRALEIVSVLIVTPPPLFTDAESKRVKEWTRADHGKNSVLTGSLLMPSIVHQVMGDLREELG